MVTNLAKLVALANPEIEFVRNIRVAEEAVAGYSFANAWASCPPAGVSKLREVELRPMPVSGRGRSRDEAIHVMMLEAVERNSSTFSGLEKFVAGRAGDIGSEQWRKFLPFSNRQIANRKPGVMDDPGCVGESLSKKTGIRFSEAVSLIDGRTHLVPAALVYLGYGVSDEPCYAVADSNGCAAGESQEDATFRAMLELAERDAFGIWWFNRVERPGLEVDSDEVVSGIAAALKEEERSLDLVDLSHDLELPVVAAINSDRAGRTIYIGCAAGTSETAAARKAALEALGFWFWGTVGIDPPSRVQWLSEASFENQPWLKPNLLRPLNASEVQLDGPGLAARLASFGFEPLMVDLTKEYFEIPVVRVLAPGLRSHRPHFAPGRLFEVPVKLGWMKEPRSEDELSKYVSQL